MRAPLQELLAIASDLSTFKKLENWWKEFVLEVGHSSFHTSRDTERMTSTELASYRELQKSGALSKLSKEVLEKGAFENISFFPYGDMTIYRVYLIKPVKRNNP